MIDRPHVPAAATIDADTLRAYRETNYRVHGERPMTLRTDRHSPALAALHRRHGVRCSAFVTACNPLGRLLDEATNVRRHDALARALGERGFTVVPGIGEHPTNGWPGEVSLLVPGLDLAAARPLGERFAQNAILWSGADAVPRLVLLR